MTEPGEGRRERVARKLWDLYGGDIWPGIFHDADRRGEEAPGFDDLPDAMRAGLLANAADLLGALEGEPVAYMVETKEAEDGRWGLHAFHLFRGYAESDVGRMKGAADARIVALYRRHPPEHGTERPRIVCLCGSTRFYREYQIADYVETMRGRIVLSVGFDPHSEEHHETVGLTNAGYPEDMKERLDELHERKIDLADEVFVINVDGYIGSSTQHEIDYARHHGKPIRWWSEDEEMWEMAEHGTEGGEVVRCVVDDIHPGGAILLMARGPFQLEPGDSVRLHRTDRQDD